MTYNGLYTLVYFIVFSFICMGIHAQKFEYVIGGKFKRNFHGAKEVVLSDNSILNYSKELRTFPTTDAIIEAGVIYRVHKSCFLEARINYGTNIYYYRYSEKLSRLGFTGIYANLPLGPDVDRIHGAFGLSLNAGHSINKKQFILDLGTGMVWQPALENNGESGLGISIYENNQRRKVAQIKYYHTYITHFYQKFFARVFVQQSRFRLFKHLGYEVGYTNRFFNRYKNSVMDVRYTDKNNRTFVNKHYDLQRSLYLSVLYRF